MFTIHTSINRYNPPCASARLPTKREKKTETNADSCQWKFIRIANPGNFAWFWKSCHKCFSQKFSEVSLLRGVVFISANLCWKKWRSWIETGLQAESRISSICQNDTRLSLPSATRNWTSVRSSCGSNHWRNCISSLGRGCIGEKVTYWYPFFTKTILF